MRSVERVARMRIVRLGEGCCDLAISGAGRVREKSWKIERAVGSSPFACAIIPVR